MVRPICKDEMFLSQKAKPAEESDLPVAVDLLETRNVWAWPPI